eukprot:2011805-Amphidinium_carterae.1
MSTRVKQWQAVCVHEAFARLGESVIGLRFSPNPNANHDREGMELSEVNLRHQDCHPCPATTPPRLQKTPVLQGRLPRGLAILPMAQCHRVESDDPRSNLRALIGTNGEISRELVSLGPQSFLSNCAIEDTVERMEGEKSMPMSQYTRQFSIKTGAL